MELDYYKIEVIKQYIFNEFPSASENSFTREMIGCALYFAMENFTDFENGQMKCILSLIPEIEEKEIINLFK